MSNRIYLVTNPKSPNDLTERLVEAPGANAARAHCTGHITAKAAKPGDVARLMGAGVTIEVVAESNDGDTDK